MSPMGSRGGVAPVAHGYWTATGGTPIVVGQGDNAGVLAQRYGVPMDSLLRVNGFTTSAEVRPGARIVIPVYNAGTARTAIESPAAPPRRMEAEARAPHRENAARERHEDRLAAVSAHEKMRFVTGPQPKARPKLDEDRHARAETRNLHDRKVAEEKAAREKLAHATSEKDRERQAKLEKAHEVVASARVAKVESDAVAAPSHAMKAVANVDHETTASVPAESEKAAASEAASPEFRWPARGRVIQAFKPGSNDGINIAVPEGTPVKAAEAGVVAYAGSELKGYGNLVLIRHPNGFVSAYANNGELDVKRGESVTRGQVIAKSGQTGNVVSPQLHFELRKGQTPVNPMRYLAGL
jgi:murein DD-endopeptidase MepM/ murein hydrolase activator NlpD